MAQSARTAFANVSASQTDYILVQPIANKSIKVVSLAMVVGSSATISTFNTYPTGGPGVAISCQFQNGANGGAVLPRNEDGWFVSSYGQGLSITTGSGSTTGVLVNYIIL